MKERGSGYERGSESDMAETDRATGGDALEGIGRVDKQGRQVTDVLGNASLWERL